MDDLLITRTRLRSKATKLCNDLRSYREDRKALDPDQLALKLHHVEKLQNEIQGVQDQLDKLGQADDSSHSETMEDEIFLGSRLLKRLERDEQAQVKAESQIPTAYTELKTALSVKIPTFQGDVMKWAEFWELYAISVHNNPKFANVQRFVVLKSHLAGVALKSIQGIPVTGDGYTQAVEVLKERFDLEDVRKETLLKELLNMPSVRHGDLMGMWSLIDHLSAHTRALRTLGVVPESFSSLLLPVVKEKIPEDWRLLWARQESGNFSEFLEFLKREMRFRESARGAADSDVSAAHHLISMPAVARVLSTRRVFHTESLEENQGQHRADQSAGSRRIPVGAGWGAASCSTRERSPGTSVSTAVPSQAEPGRKENARQCVEQELHKLTVPERQGPDAVDQPGTKLRESKCEGPPCMEVLCEQRGLNDPDLDLKCHGLVIVTRTSEDEKPSERRSGPDVGHNLSPERETHNHDIVNSITPVEAGASSEGVMDGPDVGQGLLSEREALGPDDGQRFAFENETDNLCVGTSIAPVDAGASSKGVMDGTEDDGCTSTTSVEAGASSKDLLQAGCRDGNTIAPELSTDDRQMGGVTMPKRRSDADRHCRAPGCGADSYHAGAEAAPEGRKGHAGRCPASEDKDGGPCLKLGHDFDGLGWVRFGRSSYECWDPGGVSLIGCPPSA